ncbi:21 kDa protein-like [Carica papaya]|uniref:21 kDa protein-like n=1 Tax=Carica papaya TaxID=3649 RepID=UPI000B8CA425|nr:21 kDa protein-like [Carica papaya]
MKELSRTHGFNPNQAAAIQDCVADIKDSVKELQKSVTGTDSDAKMRSGASDFQVQLREIQAWVRTALEEEELCMHAFPVKGMKGKLKTVVRGRIVKTAHLTSNALALVNQYALAKPN